MSAPSTRPGLLATWCRLLRLPNLFTVPGDAVAGYVLATRGLLDWPVLGAVVSVLFLYMAGLLLNDVLDRKKDSEQRPDRPIPSGAADAWTVGAMGGLFLAVGVVAALGTGGTEPAIVAVLVAVAVLAYDTGLKEIPWVGPLVMGSCRAGSVLLGASLVGGLAAPAALVAAGVALFYTATVTALAAREASGARLHNSAYLPAGVLVVGPLVMLFLAEPAWSTGIVALFLLLCGAIRICFAGDHVQRVQITVPVYIGVTIRVMVFTQAAWCLWWVPKTPEVFFVIAVAFAVLFAGAELSSRWFHGS